MSFRRTGELDGDEALGSIVAMAQYCGGPLQSVTAVKISFEKALSKYQLKVPSRCMRLIINIIHYVMVLDFRLYWMDDVTVQTYKRLWMRMQSTW